MLSVLFIVLPIFALVLSGWVVRRREVLGPTATSELNRFVVHLALPALLFDIVANAHWREIWQPTFIATFGLGAAVVFGVTVVLRRRHAHPADAAIDGLNAAYANTGFIGFPLGLTVFGPQALGPTLIATIFTVCILFTAALVLLEANLQGGRATPDTVWRVARSLLRNPLLIAPLLGAVVLASGLTLPAPAKVFLKLLGSAASPCALVTLGLFLGERRRSTTPPLSLVGLLVALKLVAQPLLTWMLASRVFHLSPQQTSLAVLLAALPTGTGSFMVAEYYKREVGVTSRVVLLSTIISLLTLTLLLTMNPGGAR